MDSLNWVFSLYAVVLGLTLAEVLTGLARTFRLRHDALLDGHREFRIGLLTPFLAIFLMLDITSFWIVAWTVKDAISVTPLVLTFGLFATGLYYVAGSWVFPDAEARTTNLDNYYFRQKSLVFGLIFASNLITFLGRSWLTGSFGIPGFELYDYTGLGLYYLLQVMGILVKGTKANLAVLAGLLLLTFDFISGLGSRVVHALF